MKVGTKKMCLLFLWNNLNSYMDEYLKKWYKAHSFEYWHDIHRKDENLYFGYWSFELGALIKIKG